MIRRVCADSSDQSKQKVLPLEQNIGAATTVRVGNGVRDGVADTTGVALHDALQDAEDIAVGEAVARVVGERVEVGRGDAVGDPVADTGGEREADAVPRADEDGLGDPVAVVVGITVDERVRTRPSVGNGVAVKIVVAEGVRLTVGDFVGDCVGMAVCDAVGDLVREAGEETVPDGVCDTVDDGVCTGDAVLDAVGEPVLDAVWTDVAVNVGVPAASSRLSCALPLDVWYTNESDWGTTFETAQMMFMSASAITRSLGSPVSKARRNVTVSSPPVLEPPTRTPSCCASAPSKL